MKNPSIYTDQLKEKWECKFCVAAKVSLATQFCEVLPVQEIHTGRNEI